MKKLFAIIMLVCLTMSASAQEVINEVIRLSKETVANTNRTLFERYVAQFKVDAAEYLMMKTAEQMPDSSVTVLDTQALALYEYCRYFITATAKAQSNAAKANVKGLFQEVSLANPRFHDTDEELTHAYINSTDKNIATPFCLDTDWEKALEELHKRGYRY